MVATHDSEVPTGVRELALLDVLYPGAKHSNWDMVLLFASHSTGMTPDTSILVEYKAIAHEDLGSLFCAAPQVINGAICEDEPRSRRSDL